MSVKTCSDRPSGLRHGSTRYVQFVGTEISPATEGPIHSAMLVAFIELIKRRTVNASPMSGAGQAEWRLLWPNWTDVVGVDVSEAMLAVARGAHPHISS